MKRPKTNAPKPNRFVSSTKGLKVTKLIPLSERPADHKGDGRMDTSTPSFRDWATAWLELGTYPGKDVPHVAERIDRALALWRAPIPGDGAWQRRHDARILDPTRRYCRGNDAPGARRRGEHEVENLILRPDAEAPDCLGAELVDGINALALTKDAKGGRRGNVEADLLLLTRAEQTWRQLLIEVKVTSRNAWYATLELLRQLALFRHSEAANRVFHKRGVANELPPTIPVTGAVLAPAAYYSGDGEKGRAVEPAQRLIDRIGLEEGGDLLLAVWDPNEVTISPL